MNSELLELEKTGKYLFHGTASKVEIFEPRQAYNYKDGQPIPDDKPAIHASSSVEVACFKALINMQNCPKGYSSRYTNKNGPMEFSATKETLDQLESPIGYVYVFDRAKFKRRGAVEYIAYESIKPIKCIQVGKESLPSKINIISR